MLMWAATPGDLQQLRRTSDALADELGVTFKTAKDEGLDPD